MIGCNASVFAPSRIDAHCGEYKMNARAKCVLLYKNLLSFTDCSSKRFMIYKDLQWDLWRRLRDLQPVADPLIKHCSRSAFWWLEKNRLRNKRNMKRNQTLVKLRDQFSHTEIKSFRHDQTDYIEKWVKNCYDGGLLIAENVYIKKEELEQ